MNVSVRDLKNNLSAYLRMVHDGHQILITSHGKPVGQLIAPPVSCSEEVAVAALRAQPMVRPGRHGHPRGARTPIKAKRGENLSETLLDRE